SSINILMKSGIAKIADFGLSGQIGSLSLGDGTAADIFSLGVLLWEISSGKIPCNDFGSSVIEYRKNGYQDFPFPETPEIYVQLYSACWSENPEKRPPCKEVYKKLKLLLDDRDQHLP
ncbi:8453_t:CDS:1, partial [Paraglomus occultum]